MKGEVQRATRWQEQHDHRYGGEKAYSGESGLVESETVVQDQARGLGRT